MRNTLVKSLAQKAKYLFVVLFASQTFAAVAKDGILGHCNYHDFQSWKDCFVHQKLSTQLGSIKIQEFQKAKFLPRVIELDRKQPEKKLTFAEYKKLIKLPQKIEKAIAYYNANRELLESVAAKYDFEPEIIVALLGMESSFGEKQGNFNIIDSLASLSYEGRRTEFFGKELMNALIIMSNEDLAYEDFNGSWAGAMGQCQFMPSSYLAYAVDHDGDGEKNIWQSKSDIFASVAQYLTSNGWKKNAISIEPYSFNKNSKCSIKNKSCANHPNHKLINFDNNDKVAENYLVGRNYDVLMKWNRSSYFGVSVLMIADGIKKKI